MKTAQELMESSNEGQSGVQNLARLCRAIGFKDPMYFGQFLDGSYGDLINFLEDNPGAVEAVKDWISENYQEELEDGQEEEDDEDGEDGEDERD